MKATGVIRRIDDLGRIVIPKEIRKNLKIREGDSLEIYVDKSSGVILKKHSAIGEISILAKNYVDAVYKTTNKTMVVTDCETVIAVGNVKKDNAINLVIPKKLEILINEKIEFSSKVSDLELEFDNFSRFKFAYGKQIDIYGDVFGSVIILSNDSITPEDIEYLDTAQHFIKEYLSS